MNITKYTLGEGLRGRNKFQREGSLTAEYQAFRSEDDGSKPIPSLKFEVRLISQKEAKPFIEQWHYSKRCPTGKNIFFGPISATRYMPSQTTALVSTLCKPRIW